MKNMLFIVLLIALGAAIFASAFRDPTIWAGWRVLVGLWPLIYMTRSKQGVPAFLLGLLWGSIAYGIPALWLWNIFENFAFALLATLALFPGLFAWLQGLAIERGLKDWRWIVFTTANWCTLEFLRCEVIPLRFPWFTIGSTWGPNSLLPWIGVYGVSVVTVCSLAMWCAGRRYTGVLFFLVALVAVEIQPLDVDKAQIITVGCIQAEKYTFDHYVKKTEELPEGIQHVVWPEEAVSIDVRREKSMMDTLIELCRKRKMTLTLGTHTLASDNKTWFNTALTVDATGVIGAIQKPQPVHFFNSGHRGVAGEPVKTLHGYIGTPVCFDCDYEGVVRKMTAAGAEAFVVPTMDVQEWSKLEHDQHSVLFRLRACENGRWMLVCASSGVSQIIDAHGQVHEHLDAMAENTITGLIQRESRMTFYTRFGFLIPWLIFAVALWFWITLMLPAKKKKPVKA